MDDKCYTLAGGIVKEILRWYFLFTKEIKKKVQSDENISQIFRRVER